METLIEEMISELHITEEKAMEIIKAIAEFVELQHPVLKDLSKEILEKETKRYTI